VSLIHALKNDRCDDIDDDYDDDDDDDNFVVFYLYFHAVN